MVAPVPVGPPDAWLSALFLTGASLAILAGIAYAEVRGRWPRRAVATLAIASFATSLAGALFLVWPFR